MLLIFELLSLLSLSLFFLFPTEEKGLALISSLFLLANIIFSMIFLGIISLASLAEGLFSGFFVSIFPIKSFNSFE